ncbi:MAG: serine/threonine protein kinase [Phycisphaerales bacterium]|nr:serine/threonine protein kinase [Phycisphaerales bacterium]
MPDPALDRLRSVLPAGITVAAPLGGGGQGTVFRGTCDAANAAVKVFKTNADTRRVDREIDLLSQLTCPHVVRLLRHFSATLDNDPVRILAYELHDGGDLTQHLRAGAAAVSPAELIKIGTEVSTAINTLWSKRIVHRDIKPANIVRAADGHYVLVDVGFARHLDRSDLTIGGSPGTQGFRSPEQARGRKALTIHSDVFSLGITLYMLAAKVHPFGGRDLTTPAPVNTAPLTARGDLPAGFVKIVEQMLDFTPANRPTDAAARFAALGGP